MPVYMVPGNHDRRDNLKKVFADWPTIVADPDFVQFVVDDFPRAADRPRHAHARRERRRAVRQPPRLPRRRWRRHGQAGGDLHASSAVRLRHRHMDEIHLIEGAEPARRDRAHARPRRAHLCAATSSADRHAVRRHDRVDRAERDASGRVRSAIGARRRAGVRAAGLSGCISIGGRRDRVAHGLCRAFPRTVSVRARSELSRPQCAVTDFQRMSG